MATKNRTLEKSILRLVYDLSITERQYLINRFIYVIINEMDGTKQTIYIDNKLTIGDIELKLINQQKKYDIFIEGNKTKLENCQEISKLSRTKNNCLYLYIIENRHIKFTTQNDTMKIDNETMTIIKIYKNRQKNKYGIISQDINESLAVISKQIYTNNEEYFEFTIEPVGEDCCKQHGFVGIKYNDTSFFGLNLGKDRVSQLKNIRNFQLDF